MSYTQIVIALGSLTVTVGIVCAGLLIALVYIEVVYLRWYRNEIMEYKKTATDPDDEQYGQGFEDMDQDEINAIMQQY